MTFAEETATLFDALLRAPLAVVALLAWGLLLAGAARGARTLAREDRSYGTWLLVLGSAALAVRLAVPWGPLNFAESERLAILVGAGREFDPVYGSVAVLQAVAHWLGVHTATLHRLTGPVFGAVGVALTALAGRHLGLTRTASLLAGVIVLAWPAHIRYSACAGLSVPGATLWTAVFVLALPPRRDAPLQPLPLVAAVALAVLCRPEYRLFVLGVAPLAFARALPVRARLGALAALAVLLLPYLPHLAPEAGQVSDVAIAHTRDKPLTMLLYLLVEQPVALFARDLLAAPRVAPTWWAVAGAVGLVVGRGPRAARLAMAGIIAVALIVCSSFGGEDNPLFDQWRYLVVTVPFLALGVGLLADRLAAHGRPEGLPAWVLAAPLALGLVHLPILQVETDLQREYHWLAAQLAPHLAPDQPVLVLGSRAKQDHVGDKCIACTPRLAAAAAGAPGVTVLEWHEGDPRPFHGEALVIRGLAWAGPRLPDAPLAPLVESEHDVIAAAPDFNLQCPSPGAFVGPGLSPCHVAFGLYRVAPAPEAP